VVRFSAEAPLPDWSAKPSTQRIPGEKRVSVKPTAQFQLVMSLCMLGAKAYTLFQYDVLRILKGGLN
jgi:hypothetical protein